MGSAARYIRHARALVAQMDRALDFESSGRGFESSPARHLLKLIKIIWSDLRFGRAESQTLSRFVTWNGVVRQVTKTKSSKVAEIAEFPKQGSACDPGCP